MLWMFQRVMFGELDNPKNQKLLDLNAREIAIMVPLVIMIFVMGVYPPPSLTRWPGNRQSGPAGKSRKVAANVVNPVQVVPQAVEVPAAPQTIK